MLYRQKMLIWKMLDTRRARASQRSGNYNSLGSQIAISQSRLVAHSFADKVGLASIGSDDPEAPRSIAMAAGPPLLKLQLDA